MVTDLVGITRKFLLKVCSGCFKKWNACFWKNIFCKGPLIVHDQLCCKSMPPNILNKVAELFTEYCSVGLLAFLMQEPVDKGLNKIKESILTQNWSSIKNQRTYWEPPILGEFFQETSWFVDSFQKPRTSVCSILKNYIQPGTKGSLITKSNDATLQNFTDRHTVD